MRPDSDETIELNSHRNPWFWARTLLNVGMPIVFFVVVMVLLSRLDHPLKLQFELALGFLVLLLAAYFVWSMIPETASIGPTGVDMRHGPIHRHAGWADVEKIKSARILTSMGRHITTRSGLVYKAKGWKYTLSSAKHSEDDLRSAFYKSVMWAGAARGRIKVEDELHWL
jgi:hypothetical protein